MAEMAAETEGKPDERKVMWYTDECGNSGKTYLTKYLLTQGDCARFENGRSADIKYAYNGERVCIFDYSRSHEDHINYEVIESSKNGVMFSTKYVSTQKVHTPPHVVIMANFELNKSKMSADRWDVRYITPTDNQPPNIDEVCDIYLQ